MVMWFLGILVISGVSVMLYHLLLLFFMENTRKKLICGIITAVVVGTSILLYINHDRQNTIQMEEDILYIKPIPKIK